MGNNIFYCDIDESGNSNMDMDPWSYHYGYDGVCYRYVYRRQPAK